MGVGEGVWVGGYATLHSIIYTYVVHSSLFLQVIQPSQHKELVALWQMWFLIPLHLCSDILEKSSR